MKLSPSHWQHTTVGRYGNFVHVKTFTEEKSMSICQRAVQFFTSGSIIRELRRQLSVENDSARAWQDTATRRLERMADLTRQHEIDRKTLSAQIKVLSEQRDRASDMTDDLLVQVDELNTQVVNSSATIVAQLGQLKRCREIIDTLSLQPKARKRAKR